MTLPFPELDTFVQEYNEILKIAQSKAIFVRDIDLQREQILILDGLLEKLYSLKDQSIKEGVEAQSNFLLCLELAVEAVIDEFQLIISLKEDKPREAWNYLVSAQNSLSLSILNNPVNGDYLLGYAHRFHLYEKLLFPKMLFGSAGFTVGKTECSICKQSYGECDHIKGYAYMGEICSEIIHEIISVEEISLVENPADKRCLTISFTNNEGKTLDAVTHKEMVT